MKYICKGRTKLLSFFITDRSHGVQPRSKCPQDNIGRPNENVKTVIVNQSHSKRQINKSQWMEDYVC